jgi:hypothetical protein
MTDGHSCSILLVQHELRKCQPLPSVRRVRHQHEAYVEDLDEAGRHDLVEKVMLGLYPNCKDHLYVVNDTLQDEYGTRTTFRYTSQQRLKESRAKERLRLRERKKRIRNQTWMGQENVSVARIQSTYLQDCYPRSHT